MPLFFKRRTRTQPLQRFPICRGRPSKLTLWALNDAGFDASTIEYAKTKRWGRFVYEKGFTTVAIPTNYTLHQQKNGKQVYLDENNTRFFARIKYNRYFKWLSSPKFEAGQDHRPTL